MRILCDVDGVIADCVEGLGLDPELVTSFHFKDCLPPEEYKRVDEILNEAGFARYLLWYQGAEEFLLSLCALGEVVFVTSPNTHSRTWAHDRANWLPGGMKVVSTKHKELVRGDVLIEDSLENCETWCEATGKPAVLIDRPWNRGMAHGQIFRASTYAEALMAVGHAL